MNSLLCCIQNLWIILQQLFIQFQHRIVHPVPALYCIYISSIVSCIQFQHCIIVHPVPASYRVSRYSIALLCIQFQQRIEIQFPNHINFSSTWIAFTVHGLTSWCGLPGRGVNNLPVWITFLGWTTWPNHQRLTWVDFLHGWPNVHVSQCEWITLTLPDGITLVT